jgi:putative intracellular protease/amidase
MLGALFAREQGVAVSGFAVDPQALSAAARHIERTGEGIAEACAGSVAVLRAVTGEVAGETVTAAVNRFGVALSRTAGQLVRAHSWAGGNLRRGGDAYDDAETTAAGAARRQESALEEGAHPSARADSAGLAGQRGGF